MMKPKAIAAIIAAAFIVGIVYAAWNQVADFRVDQAEVERREAEVDKRKEADEVRSRPVPRDRAVILERLR